MSRRWLYGPSKALGSVEVDVRGLLEEFGPVRPGFIEKGFNNLEENKATMKKLMDRFNAMLRRVAGQFEHVTYIDLRDVLPPTKRLWANELHPKEQGFKLAAQKFAERL